MVRWLAMLVMASLFAASATAQVTPVQLSFLPSARAGAVDAPITLFATIVNSADEDMFCGVQQNQLSGLPDGVTGLIYLYEMDGGVIVGGQNAGATVPAGGSQDFLVEIRVDAEFYGTARTRVRCVGDTEFGVNARYPLVNDILLDVSDTAQPDIVMIGDTLSRDGVARVGGTGPRAALMTVAAVNIGDPGSNLEVFPSIGGMEAMNAAIVPTICEVNTAGACLAPEADRVTISNWPTNEVRLFAVRARFAGEIGVPFYPGIIRLFAAVREVPAGDSPAGATAEETISINSGEIARTSSGLTVAVSDIFRPDPDDPAPLQTMACEVRLDNDTFGFRTGMDQSRIVMEPDGTGGARAAGFGEIQGGAFVISWEQTSWNQAVAEARVHGTGSGLQVDDRDLPFSISWEASTGGVVASWEGDDAFSNDFISPGRMRCAPLPRRQLEFERDSDPADMFAGEYDVFTYASEGLGDAIRQTVLNPGSAANTVVDTSLPQAEIAQTDAQESDDSDYFWIAMYTFVGFFADPVDSEDGSRPAAGYAASDGFLLPSRLREQNGDTVADCFTLVALDTGEDTAGRDARIHVYLREGTGTTNAIAECVAR